MFDKCIHGVIQATCPTCKHRPLEPHRFEGDEEREEGRADMEAVMMKTISRLRSTARRTDMARMSDLKEMYPT